MKWNLVFVYNFIIVLIINWIRGRLNWDRIGFKLILKLTIISNNWIQRQKRVLIAIKSKGHQSFDRINYYNYYNYY